jgi:uncharacterized membrane protein
MLVHLKIKNSLKAIQKTTGKITGTMKHFPFIPFFIIFVHSPLLLTLSNALLMSTNIQNSFFYAENISQ